jgi:Ca2+-binding RTX toxin-like protein
MATRTFTSGNDTFVQNRGDLSVSDDQFVFAGGNDRLFLLRNDDLAGLESGTADMGAGDDLVVTSFNMTGTFLMGAGNDVFVSEGTQTFTSNRIAADGGDGNDIFAVVSSGSQFFGGKGNDTFISNPRSSSFDGGDGIDTYSAELAEKSAFINMQTKEAFSFFTSTAEAFDNVENIRGSAFDDQILGDDFGNRLDGLSGNDQIDGAGGNDTIAGGSGQDQLFGGTGIDTLVINGSIAAKSGVAGQFNVSGIAADGQAFALVAQEFEQVQVNGALFSVERFLDGSSTIAATVTPFADTDVTGLLARKTSGLGINGTVANETLTGKAGDDDIRGFGGKDTIKGLAGNDKLDGGIGDDRAFGGLGDDFVAGGAGNDAVSGDAGIDRVFGGVGNDRLLGGAGNDQLTGGAGLDRFFFNGSASSRGVDVIKDFSVRDDTILLDDAAFAGMRNGVQLSSTAFKNLKTGSLDANDHVIYDGRTGELFFDSNGSADGGSQLIAKLAAGLALTSADFLGF